MKKVNVSQLIRLWDQDWGHEDFAVCLAYDSYDGKYDEDIDYVDTVGVDKDNNIYFAKDANDLLSLEQNDKRINKYIVKIKGFSPLVLDVKHLLKSEYSSKYDIYAKTYDGYVLPVSKFIVDLECKRIVFLVEKDS